MNPTFTTRFIVPCVALLCCITFSSKAQLCFIGQTKKQIENFWLTKVNAAYFDTGTWDNTHEKFFVIQAPDTVTPIFSATFDKAGKCKEHSTSFTGDYLSRYVATLNKNKNLKRDDKNDRWVYKVKSCFFKIIDYKRGNDFSIDCTHL